MTLSSAFRATASGARTAVSLLRFVWAHPVSRRSRTRALARLVRWQVLSRLLKERALVQVDGFALYCYPGSTAASGFIYVGLPEFDEMTFLLQRLREGDLFVDVGANVGGYTLLAAALAGSRVFAVEPDPSAGRRLRENVALNRLDARVEVLSRALGEREVAAHLTRSRDAANYVLTSAEGDSSPVDMTTLDAVLGDHTPTLMKLDVEGMEAAVLRGGTQVLQRPTAPDLLLELNGACERYGETPESVAATLYGYGYELFEYSAEAGRLEPWAPPSYPRTGNLVATKDLRGLKSIIDAAGARVWRQARWPVTFEIDEAPPYRASDDH